MQWLLLLLVLSPEPKETNPVKLAAHSALRFYQVFISPGQGEVCNFYPTCSRFAQQSIRKYGPAAGILMAADRLMRCNPGAYKYYDRYYPGIRDGRMIDPPENNYLGRKYPRSYIRRLYRIP